MLFYTRVVIMETHVLLMARPIFNTFLVLSCGLLCYLFIRLYKARMVFVQCKRLGLVGLNFLNSSMDHSLICVTYTALCTSTQSPIWTSPLPQKKDG